jgi:hypothetical protein
VKIMGRLGDACPNGHDCHRIHDTDGDQVIVQGDKLTDPAVLAELRMPEHETAVLLDRTVIHPAPMSLEQLAAWIDVRHTRHLLRIENLRAYAAASDGGDFPRYLDGQDAPLEGAGWRDHLRSTTAAGRRWSKVHILGPDGLSDYERYEFEWGFCNNVRAGEEIRILPDRPDLHEVPDFWVIDHEHVARMAYDSAGRFLGAEAVTGPTAAVYRALAVTVWSAAVPFTAWWDAHPEFHRRVTA